MNRQLYIIGAGGHAASVANVALSAGYTIGAFLDARKAGQRLLGADVLDPSQIGSGEIDPVYAIAIGDNATRKRVFEQISAAQPAAQFPPLIHASASLGVRSELGDGSVVMPNSTIGPNAEVGQGCIVNTNAALDHDGQLGDFGSLAPGVVVGGNVSIGPLSAISIGAVVKHGLSIGRNTVIGAASYVHHDIADDTLAYGTPCRPVAQRAEGDPYLA